ncbi:hypothetical protein IU486_13415 [Streptomyces gardneri]|uniref:hypothetical protein n=1 Tax=Nocardia sputi TaxID=2943705 RepID=UPI001894772A|nr:hypothetical protein [Nocardia sputi]MBF6165770.1 hypothetical protein [Streptomyces gardneri]
MRTRSPAPNQLPLVRYRARWDEFAARTRTLPFHYHQHETLRALEVVDLAGTAPVPFEPRLESTSADRSAAEPILRDLRGPWTTACPVCDRDCTDETLPRCPHDVSFVAGVPTGDVCRDIDELLDQSLPM